MEVKVEPMVAHCVISKREVRPEQYQIVVDGKKSGVIGFHQGASPLMFDRWSPMELREIEKEVRRQLIPQEVGRIRQPGLIPEPKKPRSMTREDFE